MKLSQMQVEAKAIAKASNIDDWIGILDGVLSAIKKCRESRQDMPEAIHSGFLAKITMRRELRQSIDDRLTIRQLNQIADAVIDRAQELQQEKPAEFQAMILQADEFEQ